MRSYPKNSPEAAARIVALVLISDGHVCRSEIEALQQLQAEPRLGLATGGFAQVVHTLCEDLLMDSYASGGTVGHVDAHTLAALMAEVDLPALQLQVLQLASAAAGADEHLADGEARVLAAARQHWPVGHWQALDGTSACSSAVAHHSTSTNAGASAKVNTALQTA